MAGLQITFPKGSGLTSRWPKAAGGYTIRELGNNRIEARLDPFQTWEDTVTGETIHYAYALPVNAFPKVDFAICLSESGGRLGTHRGVARLACLPNGDKMTPVEILTNQPGLSLTHDQARFVTQTHRALEVRVYRVRLALLWEVWAWQIQTMPNGSPGYQHVFLDRSPSPIAQGGSDEVATAGRLSPVIAAAIQKTFCSERTLFWAETCAPNEAAMGPLDPATSH